MRQRRATSARGAAKAAPQGAFDLEPEFLIDDRDEDLSVILKDLLGRTTFDPEVMS